MPDTSLVVIDPGHFHASLVQQQMYPGLRARDMPVARRPKLVPSLAAACFLERI
jgi:hypothetical protein